VGNTHALRGAGEDASLLQQGVARRCGNQPTSCHNRMRDKVALHSDQKEAAHSFIWNSRSALVIGENITSWTLESDNQRPNIHRFLLRSGVQWRDLTWPYLVRGVRPDATWSETLASGKMQSRNDYPCCHCAFVWATHRAAEVPRL
jgi:hypothetical protein